jgi:hypothetical protein
MRASWCEGSDRRVCEDFAAVPVNEIVEFEVRFPAILRAKGHLREAELMSGYDRTYWAARRHGRLYIVGNLVCRERVSAAGVVLLLSICPAISVTFLAGHPNAVEFQID